MVKKPTQQNLAQAVSKVHLPDFMRPKMFLRLILSAQIAVVCLVAMRAEFHVHPWMDLFYLTAVVQVMVITWALLFAFVQRLRPDWSANSMLAVGLVLAAALGAAAGHLGYVLAIEYGIYGEHTLATQVGTMIRGMVMAMLITGVFMRFLYVYYAWRLGVQKGIEARTQALQARIRPHFLFNTLNTIAQLTSVDAKAAEMAVEDLANLYRSGLADTGAQHTLSDEITTCESYLSIEQYRMGERLQVVWDLANLPMNTMVPILCLQPLLENALYHGIEPLPEGGELNIKGWQDRHIINIKVSNPRAELPSSRKGNNIAMDNIRQRLSIHFGAEGMLEAYKTADEYHVTLSFPYTDEKT